MDYQRLSTLGKEGCFVRSGVFTANINRDREFTPKPMPEILKANRRISILIGNLENKKGTINEQGDIAKSNYNKFLRTKVETCGFGTLLMFDYSDCLARRQKQQIPLQTATQAFTKMGNMRRDLYADYSELMMYAPDRRKWRDLCVKKIEADRSQRALSREVSALAEKALKKHIEDEKAQAEANNQIAKVLAMLQAFMRALEAMIAMAKKIFEAFVTGIYKVLTWGFAHPKTSMAIGGIAVLSVLGFVFRPYLMVASAVFRE